MTFSFSASCRSALYKRLIVLLLAIAAVSAVSQYASGNWALDKVPQLNPMPELRQLLRSGLELPGWQTLDQKAVEMGGHKWSAQAIAPQSADPFSPSTLLLLRP